MGIPLMNALLPDYPEATAFSAVFFLSMGILSWTVGVACITGDVKYISLKKAFLNPSMLGMVIALPLFLLRISLPDAVMGPVSLLAKMTTPVCMLILGMRFGTVKLREIFSERSIYPSALVKLDNRAAACLCRHLFHARPLRTEGGAYHNVRLPDRQRGAQSVRALRRRAENRGARRAFVHAFQRCDDSGRFACAQSVNKTGFSPRFFVFREYSVLTKKRFYFILTL